MREDLVDDRRVRDAGDEAHRAMAGRTRVPVDVENLLQKRRPAARGPVGTRRVPRTCQSDSARPYIGNESTAGLLFTDRTEGARYNRVGGFDTHLQFRTMFSIEARAHGSMTRSTGPRRDGSMLEINTGRTGRSYGYRYGLMSASPDVEARAGFENRTDLVRAQVNQRWTRFRRKGGWWDQAQNFVSATSLWMWDDFTGGRVALELRASLDNTITIRGGWRVGVQPEIQSLAFDPRRYSAYAVARTRDTVAFQPGERQTIGAVQCQLNSPQWRYVGFTLQSTLGQDPDFFETTTVQRREMDLAMGVRPSRQVRVGRLVRYQRDESERDATRLSEQVVPRLRLEYQFTRALFLRFIGQRESRRRDALRDPCTDAPILQRNASGALAPIAARQSLLERAETMLAARGDRYGRATTYTADDAPPPYAR